jgi:hypothetical protein
MTAGITSAIDHGWAVKSAGGREVIQKHMTSADIANQKLEALRKREAALKTAIARELVRQQKRKEKEDARLCSIIGAVLLQQAATYPEMKAVIKSGLQSATLTESERKLLRAKGWH